MIDIYSNEIFLWSHWFLDITCWFFADTLYKTWYVQLSMQNRFSKPVNVTYTNSDGLKEIRMNPMEQIVDAWEFGSVATPDPVAVTAKDAETGVTVLINNQLIFPVHPSENDQISYLYIGKNYLNILIKISLLPSYLC